MPEPLHNWDKIVHKNVRCEDICRKYVAMTIIIIVTSEDEMSRYRIPKSVIERYNGDEVILKLFG